MSEPAEKSPPPRRRRILSTPAVFVLVAAGVLAAWGGHVLWRGEDRGPADRLPPRRTRPPSVDGPPGAATQPGKATAGAQQLAEHPLAGLGIAPLKGDPGGIPPPPGAIRRTGLQRLADRQLQQQATYECDSTIRAVADHYKRLLRADGFELLTEDVPAGSDRTVLVFWRQKDPARAILLLRNAPGKAKIVRVALTVLRPAGQERPGQRGAR